jgi:hypothetical protein
MLAVGTNSHPITLNHRVFLSHDKTISPFQFQNSIHHKGNPMKLRLSAVALTVLALAGCGNKPPSCSDDKTVNIIKSMYLDSFQEQRNEPSMRVAVRELNFKSVNAEALSVIEVRTTSTEEKLGKLTCEGTLSIKLDPTVMAHLDKALAEGRVQAHWTKDGIKKTTNSFTNSIFYTSQLTDDKKQQIVEMRGHQDLAVMVLGLGLIGAFNILTEREEVDSPESTHPTGKKTDSGKASNTAVPDFTSFLTLHPHEAIKSEYLQPKFKALLHTHYADFMKNLNVAGSPQLEGDFLYAHGNAPHSGGSEEASFAVNRKTGEVYAAILRDNNKFQWFGAKAAKDMPSVMQVWLKEKGAPL